MFILRLTELVPEQPALVRHGRALRLPQDEPRVRQKLLRHEGEHAGAVRVPHAKHFPDLEKRQKEMRLTEVLALCQRILQNDLDDTRN